MTLPATDSWDVVGLEGERYKVAATCSNPDCRRFSDHVHHIVRRSQLKGDYAWVRIHGDVHGNLTGLCWQCHNDVTGDVGGHRAAIRFSNADRTFYWCWVRFVHDEPEYVKVAPLHPQPPTPETLAERVHGHGPDESESCPFCGQTRRRREPAAVPGEPRRRKNWTVSVPDDTENGAEILDSFVQDVADLLGAGEWSERNKRYWSLVAVLTWVMQHREEFAQDGKAFVS